MSTKSAIGSGLGLRWRRVGLFDVPASDERAGEIETLGELHCQISSLRGGDPVYISLHAEQNVSESLQCSSAR